MVRQNNTSDLHKSENDIPVDQNSWFERDTGDKGGRQRSSTMTEQEREDYEYEEDTSY